MIHACRDELGSNALEIQPVAATAADSRSKPRREVVDAVAHLPAGFLWIATASPEAVRPDLSQCLGLVALGSKDVRGDSDRDSDQQHSQDDE